MLKSLIDFAIERRVTIVMFTVAIALFGFVSLSRLKLNLLPDLSYPTITIRTELPGAAPLELETLITRPVEESVSIIRNVREVRSVSRAGQSDVTLEFLWGTDMDIAGIDVREKLDLLQLPIEAKRPLLLRFDPASEPVMRLALMDEGAATGADSIERLKSLRRFAEDRLETRPRSGRGFGCSQGQRRLRRRSAGLRRPAEARAAGTLDRRRHAPHPRREREPVRRPARAGHAALPGAHAERVRERRADGERDHRDQGRAARLPARRRERHARLQGPRGDHARQRQGVDRTRRLQGRRREHRGARQRRAGAHQGAREEPAGGHPAASRSTTSPRSSPRRSAK